MSAPITWAYRGCACAIHGPGGWHYRVTRPDGSTVTGVQPTRKAAVMRAHHVAAMSTRRAQEATDAA